MTEIDWQEMPADPGDLPWQVRAGKMMMWFFDFKDRMRGSRGIFIGRWRDDPRGYCLENDDGAGSPHRQFITHYADMGVGPDGKPFSHVEERKFREKGVDR